MPPRLSEHYTTTMAAVNRHGSGGHIFDTLGEALDSRLTDQPSHPRTQCGSVRN
jgi:hypothetical protein